MRFDVLDIPGAYRISPRRLGDARGAFARVYCADTFAQHGLNTDWVQMNTSVTAARGTVRGLHYQRPPFAEVKLVRCVRGRVLDVFVDLRAGSDSYGRACAVELDSAGFDSVYIPAGCAHGFQTLTDNVELHYCHSALYTPEAEGGIDVTDPALGIDWPLPIAVLSDRDRTHPPLATTEPLRP